MLISSLVLGVSCFHIFFILWKKDDRDIAKQWWGTYSLIPVGAICILVMFIPEYLQIIILYFIKLYIALFAFSLLIFLYDKNLIWLNYKEGIRKTLYLIVHFMRIIVLGWYIYKFLIIIEIL